MKCKECEKIEIKRKNLKKIANKVFDLISYLIVMIVSIPCISAGFILINKSNDSYMNLIGFSILLCGILVISMFSYGFYKTGIDLEKLGEENGN